MEHLCGDTSKAKEILGWEPIIAFDELIREMVQNDLKEAEKEYGT